MYESIYRRAIHESWQVVWHNKILWVLGLLSIAVGQFGLGDFLGKLLYWNDSLIRPLYFITFINNLSSLMPHDLSGIIGVIWSLFILLLIFILTVFVSVSAQGALVAAAADWYKTQKTGRFSVAWRKGVEHFVPVLIINILEKIALGLLLIILAIIISCLPTGGFWVLPFMVLIFSLIFLGAFIVTTWAIYSIGYIIVDGKKPISSLQLGWKLLRDHLVVSIELSILLFLAGWILLSIAIVASVLAFLPSALFWIVGTAIGSSLLMWFGIFIGLILLTLVIVGSGALFNAFTTCAWIYCFMKMKHVGIISRIVYGVKKLLK